MDFASILDFVLHYLHQGVTQASIWQTILYGLIVTHITIISVTVYLHRAQAHRSLTVHPILDHFFRFWLWLTTSMITREWAAIHRKHHAKCETIEDPHSPQVLGLRTVLRQGAELYRAERHNAETIERYSHGTPNDWIDRNLYQRHANLGIALMLIINVVLLGAKGITVWAIQMIWIPIMAAGVINGIGHYFGYRNFAVHDASTNILPWGILIGGEELHNNHHSFPTSARLSMRWFEFDLGWIYIKIFSFLGLVKVRHVAPKLRFAPQAAKDFDIELLKQILTHRYEIMRRYTTVMKRYYRRELKQLKEEENVFSYRSLRQIRRDIAVDFTFLSPARQAKLTESLKNHQNLAYIIEMRQRLSHLWNNHKLSNEQLLSQVRQWCEDAEKSQIQALQNFAHDLKRLS